MLMTQMEKTIVVMECLMPEFLTGLGQLWADNQVMRIILSDSNYIGDDQDLNDSNHFENVGTV